MAGSTDKVSALAEKLASMSFKPSTRRSAAAAAADAAIAAAQTAPETQAAPVQTPAADTVAGVGLSGMEGTAVRVAVRCRPLLESTAKRVTFGADPGGKDKLTLRLEGAELGEGQRQFKCNAFFGPETSQDVMFEQAAPIVASTMEGYNGTIFAYGITGSGKTHTMTGPNSEAQSHDTPEAGIVQRASRKIFEYIRDRSAKGEVFMVEASFLEVYSPDGSREQLIDLLSDTDRRLEIKEDPAKPQSYTCENLRRVPIKTPNEMCDLLALGRQRCQFMESNASCMSSRAHCIFMLTVESLSEKKTGSDPQVQRGKLMLVDLAGSESMKRLKGANEADEELRRKQAQGINRVLTSLGTVVHNINTGIGSGNRDSALTMLLRDCLGGNARALLIANVGPEQATVDETVKTLTFAQKMMAVRNKASVNRIDQEQSSLLQMRQRHSECIQLLQDKVNDEHANEQEERKRLQNEMEDLNKRLLTKESAETTLEEMREDQFRKIDEMKEEMNATMAMELDKMRRQSVREMDNLRKSVAQHVSQLDTAHQTRHSEEHEQRLQALQQDVQEALKQQRAAEEEASDLRVKLASAEERARMLADRQEELKRERTDFDEERRALRQQSDQQWQKLTVVEGELQRFKAEAEVKRQELARLNSSRVEDAENMRKERESCRQRETELQQEIADLSREYDEAKRDAELHLLRTESEQRDSIQQLKSQIERLEVEAKGRAEQLEQAQKSKAHLEKEKQAAKQREEGLRQQLVLETRQFQEELEEARHREAELMHMLNEVQDSIIVASASKEG